MKEQVKEWIADKNLTTDSFDSIMIGVIYNSGHSTLDDPDVRKWIETHPSEFRGMLLPNLTDDQQVVLDDLINYQSCADCSPFVTIFAVDSDYQSDSLGDKLRQAYEKLSDEQQFQVLAAFAEWGLSTLDN